MKRRLFAALCLIIAMLMTTFGALGEPAPSNTPVLINGLRSAFFDHSGTYLPMMDDNGCVYAPALPLGESLRLDTSVDANTKAVTVNNVRVAFFDQQGNYLPPVVIDGVVYVPLQAFLDTCSVDYVLEDGAYMITVGEAEPTAAPTAVPTAAPTAAPVYGYVPLNKLNFLDFFTIETGCSYPDINRNLRSFTVTSKLTCRATTSYGLENVSFKVTNFGTIKMPSSGYVTDSIQDTIYKSSYSEKNYVLQQSTIVTSALLRTYSLESASGKLRMSWQEAQTLNQSYYEYAEGYLGLGAYDKAITMFNSLATVDYADSADRAKAARADKAAAEKAAADRREQQKEDKYNQAIAAMEQQDYAAAIPMLEALAKDSFKDSSDKLAEARNGEKQQRYDAADGLLAQGDTAAALEAFNKLAEENYTDAATRAQMIHYAEGERLLAEGKYQEASDAFTAAGDYSNAVARILEPFYVQAEALLAAEDYQGASDAFAKVGAYKDGKARVLEPFYVQAEKLLAQGDYDGAADAFAKAGDYSDAQARISQTYNQQAETLLVAGDYYGALNAWSKAGDNTHIREIFGLMAEKSVEAGDTAKAILYYDLIGDDAARAKIADLRYAQGQAAEAAGDADGAMAAYRQAGEHAEAKARYQELAYEKAAALYKAKDYEGAYRLYDTLRGYSDVDAQLKKSQSLKKAGQKITLEKLHAVAQIGDYITYGTYEGKPLSWKVIDKDGDKIFVICRTAFTTEKAFGKDQKSTNWSNSNWRNWLNGVFIKNTFSSKEQKAIVKTKNVTPLPNHKNANTTDSVFLLSKREVWNYFSDPVYDLAQQTALRETVGQVWPEFLIWYPKSNDDFDERAVEYSGQVMPVMWLNLANTSMDWESVLLTWGFEPTIRSMMDAGEHWSALNRLSDNKKWHGYEALRQECYYRQGVAGLMEGDYTKAYNSFNSCNGYGLANELLDEFAVLNVARIESFSQVGNVVTFGQYEQNAVKDGAEPLEWIVLAAEKDRALLVTRRIIDARYYHSAGPANNLSWANSSVRSMLNGSFLKSAFSESEQKYILETELTHSTKYDATGETTRDKVFLLSYQEEQYWKDYKSAEMTEYAKRAKINTEDAAYNGQWMLRDLNEAKRSYVYQYKTYAGSNPGKNYNESSVLGIRPAMWVSLNPDN